MEHMLRPVHTYALTYALVAILLCPERSGRISARYGLSTIWCLQWCLSKREAKVHCFKNELAAPPVRYCSVLACYVLLVGASVDPLLMQERQMA
jgi:hypothetical protein